MLPVAELLAHMSAAVEDATAQELPCILGVLEQLKAQCWTRLTSPTPGRVETAPEERFLTAAAAAAIAGGVSPKTIYAWAAGQPWACRPTKRTFRVQEVAFRRWLAQRR